MPAGGREIHHEFRRRSGRDQADDQFGFLVVETALGHGRDVGNDGRSFRAGHRQRPRRSLLDVRCRRGQPDISDERMAGDGGGEDGGRPGKGTRTIGRFSPSRKSFLAGEQVLAELMDAKLYFAGSARASWTSSCKVCAGTEGWTRTTDGDDETRPTGAKL